jgi:hypothetical protein
MRQVADKRLLTRKDVYYLLHDKLLTSRLMSDNQTTNQHQLSVENTAKKGYYLEK